ncbi:unnamed protein product [Caenorhabditis auriculariae]|uniref:IRS-type PTB domain-containing protein n=1 Tax=Caenorhabditis auriculariae TaxID=2777116 RepID=A0A8S1HPS8_9PELO|nr:unnamed protein product [Caenorhabditis auriculariae]
MRAIRAVAHALLGNRNDVDRGDDPSSTKTTSFRVYIHRRNKLIHAWLRITRTTITLEKSKNDSTNWPLQFLRRYGYTSAGIFFFESGRRCQSGEGLHCFQSKKADEIFELVQAYVEEYANECLELQRKSQPSSRRQSFGSTYNGNHLNHQSSTSSIASTFSLRSRGTSTVRPMPSSVQRFRSEGMGSDILSMDSSHGSSNSFHIDGMGYHSYHRGSNSRHRQVVLPPPPRPRSYGEPPNPNQHPQNEDPNSFGSFQTQRSTSSGRINSILKDQRIVGSILSERVVPSRVSEYGNGNLPPYINISTQEVAEMNERRNSAATANAAAVVASAVSSMASGQATPNTTVQPFWGGQRRSLAAPLTPPRPHVTMGTLSRQLQRFTIYTTSPSVSDATDGVVDRVTEGAVQRRYVNMEVVSASKDPSPTMSHRQFSCPDGPISSVRTTPPTSAVGCGELVRSSTGSPLPWLNYAHFVPVADSAESRAPSRCSSIGRSSDTNVNYTQLDVDRTRALQKHAEKAEQLLIYFPKRLF